MHSHCCFIYSYMPEEVGEVTHRPHVLSSLAGPRDYVLRA